MKTYYECSVCGNLVEVVRDSGMNPVCCGKEMKKLVPCSSDGKTEYHIPVCKIEDRHLRVNIGEQPHPHTAEHHIEWIAMETNWGIYKRYLTEDCEAHTSFHLGKSETPIAVYAYCNLHGLWVTKL